MNPFVIIALVIILNTFILYLYSFFQQSYSFFNKKHFPTLKPKFIFGNIGDTILMKKPLGLCFHDLHKQLEPHAYAGVYIIQRPAVLIRDPELIKDIFTRDFDFFRDRGLEFKQGEEPLHHNLLRMEGDEWKKTRCKLSPFFTLSKMKTLFESMQQCANMLKRILDKTNGEPFDMKILCEQYAIDVIGSCAFGINFSAMEDPNSPILRMARKIFQFRFKTIFRHAIPHPPKLLLKMFKLSYMDEEVQDFFMTTMRKAINLRKRSLNPRNDLVTILLFNKNRHISENPDLDQEKMSNGEHNEPIEEETTMEFKVAQCYVFFAAGFETTSSALSYLMMELALNRSIQNKVREEIIEILQKYNGEITNDSVREMTYTDMVISEGLRLHAPAVILIRKCTKEYQIPNSKAIIPEKMLVVASVLGLHKDPRYYEKPDEFYPEHFTEEAKNNRPSCAYIPFGEGPRACIGERFAKFEIKLAVIHMIKDYVFEISPKMKFPLEYAHDMKLGLMAPRGGIWLQCKKYEMQKPLTSYTSYEEKLDLLDLDSLDSMAE